MKRIISVVLTLAMLCPALAYFAAFGASAALEVDDGASMVPASAVINESWDFDDMTAGETLTAGYMDSHASGAFGAVKNPANTYMTPEMWVAVADQSGGYYITSENSHLAIRDDAKLLLARTYELSFKLKVDACGSDTTLVWWSDKADGSVRHTLLRYTTGGYIGYTTDNTTSTQVYTSTKATPAEWHSYRLRISPTTGKMSLWVDGKPVFENIVNTYLRDNCLDAEASVISLFYSWGNSGMKASLDDITITPVQVDEYIDFSLPEGESVEPVSAFWDFNDGSVATKNNVTVDKGSNYAIETNTSDLLSESGDGENSSKMISIKTASGGNVTVTGPKFTLPGAIGDYDSITFTWKMRLNYTSNLVNVFRMIKNDGGTQNLFRVRTLAKGGSSNVNFLSDNGTTAATIKSGEWNDFSVTLRPRDNKVSVVINGKSSELNGNSNLKTIFNDLLNNDKPFSVIIFFQSGMKSESFIDDISITATPHLPSAEDVVDGAWKESSFDMTTPSDTGGMNNDDWCIATDPAVLPKDPVAASWDFNDGKMPATKNNIKVNTSVKNVSYGAVSGDTENTSGVMGVIGKNEGKLNEYTLPGAFADYDKITVSWKMRIDEATNYINVFRINKQDGSGKYSNTFRIMCTTETASARYADNGGPVVGTFNRAKWSDVKIELVPKTASITITFNGQTTTKTGEAYLEYLRDNGKAFSFMLHYHIADTMSATVYYDDLSVSAEFKAPDVEPNTVLKTVTDTNGHTKGILAIKDTDLLLTETPFEISFDYRLNQKPSDYLNLIRFKMNNSAFTILRLAPGGILYNYTSSGYVSATATSGENIQPNVAKFTLGTNTWYNIRAALDPNTGHVMIYVNNTLISDYNLNDVYIDVNGNPVGITKDAKQMIFEISSQWTSDITTNDCCIDNLRVRTLNYTESTKIFHSDANFEKTAKGSLDEATFSRATGLYIKSLDGSFSVDGGEGSRYVKAVLSEGSGVKVDMTNNGRSPLATDTVTLEGNFTLSSLGEGGKLDIYSLKRGDKDAVSILSVASDGKLYLGESYSGKTLSVGEVTNIKVIFAGLSGTAELYVDDQLLLATTVLSELPVLKYTDSLGNSVGLGASRFITVESDTEKNLAGGKLQLTDRPDMRNISYPEDTLNFLAVDGNGSWTLFFDDLKIYNNTQAPVFVNRDSDVKVFEDVSGKLFGNKFIADFALDAKTAGDKADLVTWTLDESKTSVIKTDGQKLYSPDGTVLASLNTDGANRVAVAFISYPWEDHNADNDHVIDAVAYLNGEVIGNYSVAKGNYSASGALEFHDDCYDAIIYLGDSVRNHRAPADESGVTFEGYNAFFADFENENFFVSAEANSIDYVEWAFPVRNKTVTDWEGASIKLAEHVTEEDNSFFRLRRPEVSSKPTAYMEYNLDAMGQYSALFSVEMELRYSDAVASSLNIATLYDKNMSGKLNLLSVGYDNKLYFENNGIRYYLCDGAGNNLTVNKVSADEFTSIGLVVDKANGSYAIWVNGVNAYYFEDGQESGKPVCATSIPVKYTPSASFTACAPKIRLVEGSDNAGSDSIIDVDNISIDIIKNGIAPINAATQVIKDGGAIRFIATVDTLYLNYVGFEIEASSNLESTTTYTDKSNLVFSSIVAAGETVEAEDIGGRYIVTFSVTDLEVAEYVFTVRPYAEILGQKVYGEAVTYEYNCTTVTSLN